MTAAEEDGSSFPRVVMKVRQLMRQVAARLALAGPAEGGLLHRQIVVIIRKKNLCAAAFLQWAAEVQIGLEHEKGTRLNLCSVCVMCQARCQRKETTTGTASPVQWPVTVQAQYHLSKLGSYT